jgi:hypothetical protein
MNSLSKTIVTVVAATALTRSALAQSAREASALQTH